MKFIPLLTVAFYGLASADHKCDDGETGADNAVGPAILAAYEKATEDKQLAFDALKEFDSKNVGALNAVTAAEALKAQGQAQWDVTCGKTDEYHQNYEDASNAFADCKPHIDAEACDHSQKNLLSLQMVEAGKIMIDNDNTCKTAQNALEQYTLELNQAKAENEFANAALANKRQRLEEDLDTAAIIYQEYKDQVEQHDVTGTSDQNACKENQYHNDMAEIERLGNLIKKCKAEVCDEIDALEYDDIEYVGIIPIEGMTADGKWNGAIKFPESGNLKVTGDFFWEHYNQSGWLDFLSFFMYAPAIIGCAVFKEYDYGFCFGNFAYVLVDAFSKKIAPKQMIGETEESEDAHIH